MTFRLNADRDQVGTFPSRSVAALGDVCNPSCFGGAPWQFLQESRRQSFAERGWTVDVKRLRLPRIAWNAVQLMRGRSAGGFQYSKAGRAAALAQIPRDALKTEVISFHQHFPDPESILQAGGETNFYIDATYTQLFPTYGFDRSLDRRTIRDILANERRAFSLARRVIVNQSWALRSLQNDYALSPGKCAMILPAANYPVYPGLRPQPYSRAGVDRPFVLGFIGKDWRRKGLLFLDQVAAQLRATGWKVEVKAIGFPPKDGPTGTQVQCLGFIDKRTQFGPFLHSCDLGCLFSSAEAAGTAVLEFLGVGVPVAGFAVNGLADLLPATAGFRFELGTVPGDVASRFSRYLSDEVQQVEFTGNARRLAAYLQWDRCVAEFKELWATGALANPFRINSEAGERL